MIDLAAFDIHILRRKGAAQSYSDETVAQAQARFAKMDDGRRATLSNTLTAGLPGSGESWSLAEFSDRLAVWDGVSADQLRQYHVDFLSEIAPLAQEIGIRLACHPDDPPFLILGLPRIMSTAADYRAMFDAVDLPANGMTFCTGSLGARADNDLPEMVREFGARIHFAHLRSVRRETDGVPCTFHEDDHLAESGNMLHVIKALVEEEARRTSAGEPVTSIPMRPDHGHELLSDIRSGGNPGYTAIGRRGGWQNCAARCWRLRNSRFEEICGHHCKSPCRAQTTGPAVYRGDYWGTWGWKIDPGRCFVRQAEQGGWILCGGVANGRVSS